MSKSSQAQSMFLLLGFFSVCFLVFYPQMILLLDEYSYFNRGLAFTQGEMALGITDLTGTESIDLSGTRYLMGTPLLIAIFIALIGNSSVFLLGWLCFSLSAFLMIRVLQKLDYSPLGVLVLFLFPPLMMLTRTLMSGMPSLLFSAIFFFVLVCSSKSVIQYFLLALIAGLSMLFRETNILIFGFFLLFLFLQEKKWIISLILGFALGIGCRLLLAHYVYGSAVHLSHAEPFSFFNILHNLTLYGLCGLVLIPLGIVQVLWYRGNYQWALKLSVAAFFLLYLSYAYNPMDYSGLLKGLLFGGRFLVPVLPLFVIAAGYSLAHYGWLQKSWIHWLLIFGGVSAVGIGQYGGDKYDNTHFEISEKIYEQYANKAIVMDHSGYTSINRYINPLRGLLPLQADLNRFIDEAYVKNVMAMHPEVYIAVSMRDENAEKRLRADRFNKILDQLRKNYALNLSEAMRSFDGTRVEVWRMTAQ